MAPSPSPVRAAETAEPPNLSALAKYFQISLYLMLVVSVLALIATGKLDVVTMSVPLAALAVKGYRWFRSYGPEFSARLSNILVVGYFVFFPFDLWWLSRMIAANAQNPALFGALLAAVHLMLFAMVVRLYSAKATRDYLFLALLGFGNMLASAILTVDTAFVIFFFIFLVLAVSTFVGLEMRRSAEGAMAPPVESGTPGARRLHTALGITSAAIALGSLFYGAGIFFLLPRFNAGFFSRFNLQPSLISGFSEDVELGQIGEIKRSTAVVMRIQVDGDPRQVETMHWRGIALTTFDGRRWFTDAHDPIAMSETPDGWIYLNGAAGRPARYSKPLHYNVLLEPVASDALFAAADPVRIRGEINGEAGGSGRGRRTFLVIDKTGSLSNPLHNFTTVSYEAVSQVPDVPADLLRRAPAQYDGATRSLYLQLPLLDPRIPALAQQIAARSTNPYDRARAMEAYLRSHYGYTLDLAGRLPPKDPLAYFLFDRKAGHCEYFAAAMTVMLRSLGIPARYINGFLPGEYNSLGGDYIIRARDAHSWVEAFFPGYGWITFDPTPPSNDAPSGLTARLALYWDWFELRWSEWVINYDFLHQFTLARNLQRASRNWTENFSTSFDHARNQGVHWVRDWQKHAAETPPWLFIVLVVMIAGIAAARSQMLRERFLLGWQFNWRWRAGRKRGALSPEAAVSAYRRMLQLLEQRGLKKPPAQTALEFASGLPDDGVREPATRLTDLYLASRFGRRSADTGAFSALLTQLQAALRARRQAR